MTAVADSNRTVTVDQAPVPKSLGKVIVNWITSTDHKTIGYMPVSYTHL